MRLSRVGRQPLPGAQLEHTLTNLIEEAQLPLTPHHDPRCRLHDARQFMLLFPLLCRPSIAAYLLWGKRPLRRVLNSAGGTGRACRSRDLEPEKTVCASRLVNCPCSIGRRPTMCAPFDHKPCARLSPLHKRHMHATAFDSARGTAHRAQRARVGSWVGGDSDDDDNDDDDNINNNNNTGAASRAVISDLGGVDKPSSSSNEDRSLRYKLPR
ncbi:hypothetical protein LZ30DRAFT_50062 [Colletotrichum cereale]|nr:hypothetical protein LZ30DRAFT_50062 [Colletotrichum cereale]